MVIGTKEVERRCVLVVESDQDQRTLLGQAIRTRGYDCEESGLVVSALAHLDSGGVEVLVTDSHFADGFADELLRRAEEKNIPSLLISAEEANRWPQGQKCLPKPLNLDDLLVALRALQLNRGN